MPYQVVGSNVFAGGVEGVVKFFDSALQLICEYSALLEENIPGVLRPETPRSRIMDSGKGNRGER